MVEEAKEKHKTASTSQEVDSWINQIGWGQRNEFTAQSTEETKLNPIKMETVAQKGAGEKAKTEHNQNKENWNY